jgi:glycine betaine/proline transport system permease protein
VTQAVQIETRPAIESRKFHLAAWRPALILAPFILLLLLRPLLPEWAIDVPKAWVVPFVDWINAVVEVLRREPIFGLFTFRDFTRAVAGLVEWPLDFVHGILVSGSQRLGLPALPWVMVAGLTGVFGWWLKGWKLALWAPARSSTSRSSTSGTCR